MKTLPKILVLLLVLISAAIAMGSDDEERFEPLLGESDLDGWVRVNTAPSTWIMRDGMLICSGKPIGQLRTTRMYQNFIMELEWRHMKPRGNAGVFVWADDITARGVPFHRSIEVQVLENAYGNTRSHTTHGDIFPIHGATMNPINGRGGSRAFPTEFRSNPSPQWNHYRIECRDGSISLAVNGKVVTRGTDCKPRKGYICLESEGGVVHYRNLRIKVFPDTPLDAEHVATADRGFRALYNGIDLDGWKATGAGWQSRDWVLSHAADTEGTLTSTDSFGDVGFVFDIRLKGSAPSAKMPSVKIRGVSIINGSNAASLAEHLAAAGKWNRLEGELNADRLTLWVNGNAVPDQPVDASASGPIQLDAAVPVDFANIFVRHVDRTE